VSGKCVDEAGSREAVKHEGAKRDRVIEITGDDGLCGLIPSLIGNDLRELIRAKDVIAAAFEMDAVEEQPAGPGTQRHSTTAPRLKWIEAPAESCLLTKPYHSGVRDRFPTQNGLARERRMIADGFTDFLKLSSRHPIHAQPIGQVLGHIAIATALAVPIDLLEQQHVGINRAQRVRNLLEPDTSLDVPGRNFQGRRPMCGLSAHSRLAGDRMNGIVVQTRLGYVSE
jgi:hypothetical protein